MTLFFSGSPAPAPQQTLVPDAAHDLFPVAYIFLDTACIHPQIHEEYTKKHSRQNVQKKSVI
jgi:hypothetical protein